MLYEKSNQDRTDKLARAQSIAHIGSWDYDMATYKLTWSDELYRIYGVSPSTFTNTTENFINLIHPDDRTALQSWIYACVSGQKPGMLEFRCVWSDGTIHYIESQGELLLDDKGIPSHISGTAQEITERKKAAIALQESEQYNRILFECSPIGLALTRMDGTLVDVNPAFANLLGRTVEKTKGLTYWEITPQSYADKEQEQLRQLSFFGRYGPYEKEYIHKDGHHVAVRLSGLAITRNSEQYILSSVEDVSVSMQTKIALERSEEQLKQAVEIAGIGFFNHDLVTETLYCSPQMRAIYGLEPDEPVSMKTVIEAVYPADRESMVSSFKSAQNPAGSGVLSLSHRIVRRDGAIRWVEVSFQTYYSGAEETSYPIRVVGATRDVSERKQAETALLQTEANLHAMLDNSPYLTWLKDPAGRYITINKVFANYLHLEDPRQAVGKTDLDLQPKELAEKYLADDAEVMTSLKQKHVEEESSFDGNMTHWVETFKTPIVDKNGQVLGTVGFARDISERKQTEAELRIAAAAFEAQESLMITDADNVILRVNSAFTKNTGYTAEEVVGQTPSMFKSGRHNADFYRTMWKSILSTGAWQGEVWDKRKNGELFPAWLSISTVKRGDGGVTHYVGSYFDITERKAAEEEINLLAFYDPLTRLPNRRLLFDRLKLALMSSARSNKKCALLFIDLDNFKILNDTLGHDVGDLLLQQVAQRLVPCVREGDTVARLGGDEFVVILEDLSEYPLEAAAQTKSIGEKIITVLNQPYQLATHEHLSTSSIGVVLFSGHEQEADELFKQADIAMYQAKKSGRNTLCFFDPQMQNTINARAVLEGELRKAIENQQFQLHYQIQVDLMRRPLGAEALIRWLHPERGLVFPEQFIALAEETGLILPIGKWVLEAACAQLKIWHQETLTCDLILAVNVSARQFHQADFVAQVHTAVRSHAINPWQLKLELTESMLLENIEDTIATMNALKAIGIQFSLDDFGSGYSSLQYLKRLPLNQLKIDQSFIRNIAADSGDKAVVLAIIAMAQSMNLDVIAEGVETNVQRQLLLGKGCTHYQGYLFGRPAPIDEFEAQLKQACLSGFHHSAGHRTF